VHYPNPHIKYLGLVDFNYHDASVVLSDGFVDYEALRPACSTSIERICALAERPELHAELGKVTKRKDVKQLMDKLFGAKNFKTTFSNI
jgi:hypothetical protein